MQTVLLVAYLLIVVALIGVILVQRSEGGGLGMGGNAGGLMTVRGSANLLTRTTAVLAALFFVTAIALTVLSSLDRGTDNILDQAVSAAPQPSTVLDALSQLQAPDVATTSSVSTAPSSSALDLGLPLPVTPASSSAPVASSASEAPSALAPAASSSVAPEPSSAPAPSSAAPATSSAAQ